MPRPALSHYLLRLYVDTVFGSRLVLDVKEEQLTAPTAEEAYALLPGWIVAATGSEDAVAPLAGCLSPSRSAPEVLDNRFAQLTSDQRYAILLFLEWAGASADELPSIGRADLKAALGYWQAALQDDDREEMLITTLREAVTGVAANANSDLQMPAACDIAIFNPEWPFDAEHVAGVLSGRDRRDVDSAVLASIRFHFGLLTPAAFSYYLSPIRRCLPEDSEHLTREILETLAPTDRETDQLYARDQVLSASQRSAICTVLDYVRVFRIRDVSKTDVAALHSAFDYWRRSERQQRRRAASALGAGDAQSQ